MQTYCPYCMTPTQPNTPCPNCGLTLGTYQPEPHHLPPGTLLANRYLLGRVLGSGGFGITYIGRDTRLDLRVAVKEYFPNTQVSRNSAVSHSVTRYDTSAGRYFEHGLERFIKEARVMAKMEKTSEIVAVRDYFEENGTAYIVMEYVDGTTFKELVAQHGGSIPAPQLLAMMRPLFGALEALHAQGLIHRDISPDNIMLENGKVRLLDFGCAREAIGGAETMTILLKPGFSPIEQHQHKGQGPWTDVYALAATIYFCITGVVPPQPADRVIDTELVPPRRLGAALSEQEETALLHAMELKPRKRFQSIRAFYECLYEGAPISKGQTKDGKTGPEQPGADTSKNLADNKKDKRQPQSASDGKNSAQGGQPGKFTPTQAPTDRFPATQKPEGRFPATVSPDKPAPGGEQDKQAASPADHTDDEKRHDAQTGDEPRLDPRFPITITPDSPIPAEDQPGADTPTAAQRDTSATRAYTRTPETDHSADSHQTDGRTKLFPGTSQDDSTSSEKDKAQSQDEQTSSKEEKASQQDSTTSDQEAKKTSTGAQKPDGGGVKPPKEDCKASQGEHKSAQEGKLPDSKEKKSSEDIKKTGSDDTKRSEKDQTGKGRPSGGPKKWVIGVGAAAILGVGILAVAIGGGPNPAPNPTLPGTPVSTETGGNDPAHTTGIDGNIPSAEENSGVRTVSDDTAFRQALGDSTVQTIRIASGKTVAIHTNCNIAKPVILEENSTLNLLRTASLQADCTLEHGASVLFNGADTAISAALTLSPDTSASLGGESCTVSAGGSITVAEGAALDAGDCASFTLDGGKLSVQGSFNSNNLVRTCNGGSIDLGSTAQTDLAILWLQKNSDLTGAQQLSAETSFNLDDAVFLHPAIVSTMDELAAALKDSSVQAVRLGADITLDRDITVSKPLLIPEETRFISSSSNEYQVTLKGTLVCRGYLDDFPLTLDGGACLLDGHTALFLSGGEGTLVNLGETILLRNHQYDSTLHNTVFVNGGTLQVGSDGWKTDAVLDGGSLWNLKGSTLNIVKTSSLTANLGRGMHNNGTVSVEVGATLVNNSVLGGTVDVKGTVDNSGGLLQGDLNLPGTVQGGLILTDADLQRFPNLQSRVLPPSHVSGEMEATSPEVFLDLCENTNSSILLTGTDVVIDGPLELTQSVVIDANASLTVSGTITVQGGAVLKVDGSLTANSLHLENASLEVSNTGEGGTIQDGNLRLTDASALVYGAISGQNSGVRLLLEQNSLLYNEGSIRCSEVSLSDSQLTNSGDLRLRNGTSITLTNSAFSNMAACSLSQGSITTDPNSLFLASNTFNLENCSVSNKGTMKLTSGTYFMSSSGNSQFLNQGFLEFGIPQYPYVFDITGPGASFINQGTAHIFSGLSVNELSNAGELILEGSLDIRINANNTGRIVLGGGTYTGTINGNQPVYP